MADLSYPPTSPSDLSDPSQPRQRRQQEEAEEDDNDELARFREQWRAEVTNTKAKGRDGGEVRGDGRSAGPSSKRPETNRVEVRSVIQKSEAEDVMIPMSLAIPTFASKREKINVSGVLPPATVGELETSLYRLSVDDESKYRESTLANSPSVSETSARSPTQPRKKLSSVKADKDNNNNIRSILSTSPTKSRAVGLSHAHAHVYRQVGSSRHTGPPVPPQHHAPDSEKAVDLYSRAVQFEQQGQLNEALHMYRRAYKLDTSVEKAYNRSVVRAERLEQEKENELEVVDPSEIIRFNPHGKDEEGVYTFKDYNQFHDDYVPRAQAKSKTDLEPNGKTDSNANRKAKPKSKTKICQPEEQMDPLSRIIRSFKPPGHDSSNPSESEGQVQAGDSDVQHYGFGFEADEEKYPVYISELPDEVLMHVLLFMDVQTIERFAKVNKKMRILTANSEKWRRLCERLYRPPITPPKWDLSSSFSSHNSSWRTTFLEEPRLRYDGIYISVCHYVRPGQSDLAWVDVTHLITYHRFLRFYPDGTVISLLTTDQPVDVVHTVKPSLRQKGLLFGRWSLESAAVSEEEEKKTEVDTHASELIGLIDEATTTTTSPDRKVGVPDPADRRRVVIRTLLEPGVIPKYEFEMDLALKTTTRGRWNKLEMKTYQSVNLANGEALGLSLKHQRPFYFSKVRSYHPSL